MAKKLVINAEMCDARKVTEETLSNYEQVVINCEALIVDAQSKELLAKYPVTTNCEDTLELEGDVILSSVNGSCSIEPSDDPSENTYLTVNGSLSIEPGTERVLAKYLGITVNGGVEYPRSMSGKLGKIKINGSATCYPDGAVRLRHTAVVDKLFVLRAKAVTYWAEKRFVLVDPEIDGKALAAKGLRFESESAIIAQSLVEDVIGLFDENTDIEIVPDGTVVVRDDMTLTKTELRRYGGKLYILGDLTLEEESRALLPKLEYLKVRDSVILPPALEEDFAKVKAEYDELIVIKGMNISGRPMLKITKWMLEKETEGISVSGCAMVTVAKDVPPDLIAERLSITSTAVVMCTPEQEGAVSLISEGVAQIRSDPEGGAGGIGEMLKGALTGAVKVVNAEKYTM